MFNLKGREVLYQLKNGSTTILVGTDLSPHEKIRLHF